MFKIYYKKLSYNKMSYWYSNYCNYLLNSLNYNLLMYVFIFRVNNCIIQINTLWTIKSLTTEVE